MSKIYKGVSELIGKTPIIEAVMGIAKETKRDPNANKRKKVSEYGMQLKEKQKLKFIYGVLEKQFRHLFELAEKMEGQAGANLITLLESRLDNVVYRMGLSMTRREARQLVVHGHYLVNGKRVDIPSYRIKEGDVISLKENSGHSHIAGYSGDISLSSKGNIPISCKKAWHRRSKNIQRCDLL